MKILDEADLELIQVLMNEFIVSVDIESKEDISIELLNYLRENLIKVKDGKLFNELCTMIEKKLNLNERRYYAAMASKRTCQMFARPLL